MPYPAPDLTPTNSLDSDLDLASTPQNKILHLSSARANVFARLQALFPSSPSNAIGPNSAFAEPSGRKESIPPKFLKVRITTWNMHESLPKGDLVELLGEVTPVNPTTEQHPPLTSIPAFAPDQNHPYHLVVVAGQECPSLSGIPLGLGAGFKLKDKEKEPVQEPEPAPSTASYGWTSILEDWYCHAGSAHVIDKRRGFRNVPGIPGYTTPATSTTPELKRRNTANASPERKGPYEILIKERMMGLYLAVYVHRDIKHLIRGTSKSVVTAGLIGGRVGNKGGVGISINLDGTTLLFVNAHLAAHEGKVLHRLNNMQKIKTSLSVEDFLSQDDPRVMGEDLTDRFDYSFIFGDLNFRLDISRLHADWLISRKDYAQALAFDQLRNLMQNEHAFVGFKEAPIHFPPTFKYDVLRTIKRPKTKSGRSGKRVGDYNLPETPLVGMEEKDGEVDEEDADEDEGEAASLASSAFTSVHSRVTTDQDLDDDDFLMRYKASRTNTGNLANKMWAAAATPKTKAKWAALLSPGKVVSLPTPNSARWSAKLRSSSLDGACNPSTIPSVSMKASSTPSVNPDASSTKSSLPSQSNDRSMLGPSLSGADGSNPTVTLTEEEIDEQDRGVYDTSSKKRVPSWCDRILWKSTVEPGDEPEDEITEYAASRPRTRVGQFFANAFRMPSRRGSHSSYTSTETPMRAPPLPPKEDILMPSPSPRNVESPKGAPPSRFVQPSSSIPQRPYSIDDIPRPAKATLSRSVTVGSSVGPRKRASTGLPLPRSKTIPAVLPASSITSTAITSTGPLPVDTLDMAPPVPPKEIHHMPSRWRFLPFFHRNTSQSTLAHDRPSTPEQVAPPLPPRPRKGDVICLSYNSLDDRGMRRLEGRSDHRPVIGSYAIYL